MILNIPLWRWAKPKLDQSSDWIWVLLWIYYLHYWKITDVYDVKLIMNNSFWSYFILTILFADSTVLCVFY